MRHAPAVGVTLSGGGAWRIGQVLLVALAAAVFGVWALLHLGGSAWPAAAAAALAGAMAWRGTQPRPVLLRWDGSAWSADGVPGEVGVMLDLQDWLLLRVRAADGRARWLPVPAADAGAAWNGLRAALYSRAAFSPPPVASRRRPD